MEKGAAEVGWRGQLRKIRIRNIVQQCGWLKSCGLWLVQVWFVTVPYGSVAPPEKIKGSRKKKTNKQSKKDKKNNKLEAPKPLVGGDEKAKTEQELQQIKVEVPHHPPAQHKKKEEDDPPGEDVPLAVPVDDGHAALFPQAHADQEAADMMAALINDYGFARSAPCLRFVLVMTVFRSQHLAFCPLSLPVLSVAVLLAFAQR